MKSVFFLFVGPPFFDAELFQLGIRDGFALLNLPSQYMIGCSLLFQGALIRPQVLIQLLAAAREDLAEPRPSPAGLCLGVALPPRPFLEPVGAALPVASSPRHLLTLHRDHW